MALFHGPASQAPTTAVGPVESSPAEVELTPGLGARDAVATTRELIRRLEFGGWAPAEAGNLVALLHGLRPVAGGWSLHEIEHLRFLRALVESGTFEH